MSRRRAKAEDKPATVKTLLTFTRELREALEKEAKKTFGERQGYLSMYVEMVLRNKLQLGYEEVEEV